jgi:hypothetical protein
LVRVIVFAGCDHNGNTLRASVVYDTIGMMRWVCKGRWKDGDLPDTPVVHQYGQMKVTHFRSLVREATARSKNKPSEYIFTLGD